MYLIIKVYQAFDSLSTMVESTLVAKDKPKYSKDKQKIMADCKAYAEQMFAEA